MNACLVVRGLRLGVEFQRELDVPRRLGAGDFSHCGPEAHVGCVELYVVKRVNEVSSELQFEPFCNLDVLRQT